jgi:hypothetical protein
MAEYEPANPYPSEALTGDPAVVFGLPSLFEIAYSGDDEQRKQEIALESTPLKISNAALSNKGES